MDPQIDKFLKLFEEELRTEYRQAVVLKSVELIDQQLRDNVISGVVPRNIEPLGKKGTGYN